MEGLLAVNPGKVTRWAHLAKPDSILWGIASNDIAGGANLATLQTRFLALVPVITSIAPTIYLADIMPRNGWAVGGTEETTRRAYNSWLRTLPSPARDVFAFAASISTDDETITPAYNADGTHPNTLGYTKNMESIVRPLSASPTRDSGVQDITSQATVGTVTSGSITFQHKNGWNTIAMVDLKLTPAGSVILFGNNHAALKPWAPGVDGATTGGANEAVTLGSSGSDYRRASLNYTGGLTIYGAVAGDVINGTITWPMNRILP